MWQSAQPRHPAPPSSAAWRTGALKEPLLAGFPAPTWDADLDAVVDRWRGSAKLILAFDECQWTAAASPELPSVLQARWDRVWKRRADIMLILCGSHIGFMEREVLGRGSPLFGRRTAQILLRPLDFREAAESHPRHALRDRARTYFICGRVPYYLSFFSDRVSVETNIVKQILPEHAALHREPDLLLREELREPENCTAVLLAIAAGDTTLGAISRRTGVRERSLHDYVQQLVELGYVHRRHPLTGLRKVARQVRFELGDPLLRFRFRFVYPNTSYLLRMGAERALRDRIRPALDAYFGACFERLCREALPFLGLLHTSVALGGLPAPPAPRAARSLPRGGGG